MTAGQRTTQNFTLRQDPLQLQAIVVTGTSTPTVSLKSSVAVTTLSPREIEQSAPRSTTEMLRYVPGFTRVESSGGEVNENITMRGILGVEYVMFMEDGLPVFPTMHTFFMNADNLFRFDENIERMEVVRGGSSSLFGSNTPGAIINFINKTGGDQFQGSMVATGGTEGLARYDVNLNGPLGDDWRFNIGGFYRYDHGVRDPGFPGIRGGQFKGNVTRLLDNGYVRFSAKIINDRNQFILDLPFENASDPRFVPGFGQYGSMNTNEALNLRVPTPIGDQSLPLDNGLRTDASWFTADAAFDLANDWHLRNSAQVMHDNQEWNALVPSNVMTVSDFITAPLPAGSYTHSWAYMGDAAQNPIGVEWFSLVMELGFVLSFGYWCTDFLVVQRAMAADSMTAARRTPLIAAVPKMLFPFLVILPGMIALVLGGADAAGHVGQGLIPAKLAANGAPLLDSTGRLVLDYDLATPMMLVRLFPSGMLGLGLTALLASFMSGMAGNTTAFNTVWTYDIYQSHIRRGASDAHYLWMGRASTVGGVALAVAAAYVASRFNNIMDLLQLVFAFVNAPLFATFALGMFWRRTTGHGAFVGLLSGTAAAAVHHGLTLPIGMTVGLKGGYLGAVHYYPSELAQTFWTAIVAWVTCFVVTIAVSLATKPRAPEELYGLVYSLTPLPGDVDLVWYKRPWALAVLVLALTAALNAVFF